MKADLVRKLSPGEGVDLEHVMQELNQLIGIASHLVRFRCLRNRVQMFAHVVGAAPRWGDDVIEILEIGHEQRLRLGRVLLAAAVRHHLAAAGLIERIDDVEPEPFQQLQRGDADRRKEGIDITGNEQSHSHDRRSSSQGFYRTACPS